MVYDHAVLPGDTSESLIYTELARYLDHFGLQSVQLMLGMARACTIYSLG